MDYKTALDVINQQEVLGKEVKVYGTVDEPLLLAKDVADWIGRKKPGEMVKVVDDSEKLKATVSYSGQRREMWFLKENGVYEVLMQSRMPIAEQFKSKIKDMLKALRLNNTKKAESVSEISGLYPIIKTDDVEEGLEVTEYQKLMLQTKIENAKIRKAQILNKIARDYEGKYKQALQARAVQELLGVTVIPIPEELKHLITDDIKMTLPEDVGDQMLNEQDDLGNCAEDEEYASYIEVDTL